MNDTSGYKKKMRTLRHLITKLDIIALQETHGSDEHWETIIKDFTNKNICVVIHSTTPRNERLGGVAFIVKYRVSSLLVRPIRFEKVVNGRVLSIKLDFEEGSISATNVHSHDFSAALTAKVVEHCRKGTDKAQRDPLGKSIHFTLGDLNFLERNELPARVGTNSVIAPKSGDNSRHELSRRKWSPVTDIAMEHFQLEHTRMGHSPQKTGDKYLIATRYDRIYSSILPWQTIQMNINTSCVYPAAGSKKKVHSDRTPVGTTVRLKHQKKQQERPIPKWLAQHPTYQELLNKAMETINVDSTDPFEAIKAIKDTMRKVSKAALKQILKRKAETIEEKMQVVLQASRAITYNLASVAKHVEKNLPRVGDHRSIDDKGNVYLCNPNAFHKAT